MTSFALPGRSLWTLGKLGLAATVCVVLAQPAGASGPQITAKPRSVMVNQSTHLVGTGFPAHTAVTLQECGMPTWVVMQQVCSPGTVTVTTNAAGRFATPFVVKLCPDASGPATRKTCYIGEPKPQGIDTIHLVGAVKITVTYP